MAKLIIRTLIILTALIAASVASGGKFIFLPYSDLPAWGSSALSAPFMSSAATDHLIASLFRLLAVPFCFALWFMFGDRLRNDIACVRPLSKVILYLMLVSLSFAAFCMAIGLSALSSGPLLFQGVINSDYSDCLLIFAAGMVAIEQFVYFAEKVWLKLTHGDMT